MEVKAAPEDHCKRWWYHQPVPYQHKDLQNKSEQKSLTMFFKEYLCEKSEFCTHTKFGKLLDAI